MKEDRMLSFMSYYFPGSIQQFILSSWPLPYKDVLKPLNSLLGLENASLEIVFRLESKSTTADRSLLSAGNEKARAEG